MLINLSYQLNPSMPLFPGAPVPTVRPHRTIEQGYRYNSYQVTLWNHCGTHVDAPRHVYEDGQTIADFTLEELTFDRPFILDVEVPTDGLLRPESLEGVLEDGDPWDFVGLRTGFGRYREEDPERYTTRNPGLGEEAAQWLVNALPHLRAVGIDTLSITPGKHSEEGWRAHRVLLNPSGNRVVVEELNLPLDLPPLQRMWIVPLVIAGIDSAWCSVLAQPQREDD